MGRPEEDMVNGQRSHCHISVANKVRGGGERELRHTTTTVNTNSRVLYQFSYSI